MLCSGGHYGHEQHHRSLPRILLMYNRGTANVFLYRVLSLKSRPGLETRLRCHPEDQLLWSLVYTNWSPSVRRSQTHSGCVKSHWTWLLLTMALLMSTQLEMLWQNQPIGAEKHFKVYLKQTNPQRSKLECENKELKDSECKWTEHLTGYINR